MKSSQVRRPGAWLPGLPRRLLTAVTLAAIVAAGGSSATLAAPSVVREVNVSANLLAKKFPNNNATEPIVAVDPSDPSNIAATYNTRGAKCGISPGVRISRDGGQTWQDAARKPWAGSGRQPNWHATIAWGPGPQGKSRLYWADTTVADCTFSDHRLSVAYSDNFGATWSPLFVYRGTPATPFGGYPDITVDRNPSSPNYGAVYAAINWYVRNADEPGFRLLASSDFGQTWAATEVAALPSVSSVYRYRYRIGYRLRTGPDGALYASFCQRDRKKPRGAVGRLAFGIARVTFNPSKGTLQPAAPVLATTVAKNGFTLGSRAVPGTKDRQRLNPCWTHGLDVDQANGDVYMAVGTYRKVDSPRGTVRLGRSTNGAQGWSWRSVPTLAPVNGRPQSAHKPALVVDEGTVFVGFHVVSDVPLATSYSAHATVGNAYAVSYDRGATFGPARLISPDRWHPDWLDYSRNASGLRDRAELAGSGRVVYIYGDGRHAAAKPSPAWGRCQVYLAAIDVGKP